jgi:hypothetical protein
MGRRAALVLVAVLLAVVGCTALAFGKRVVMVSLTNESSRTIVLQIDSPVDSYDFWPGPAAFLMRPDGYGPHFQGDAGTKVRLFTESCEPITEFILPTWGLGDPNWTFHDDGSLTSEPSLGFGDAFQQNMSDHEPCEVLF